MIITQKRLPLKYFSWFLSCLQLGFCFCVFGVLLLGCFPLLWKGSCDHPLLLSSVDIKAFLCSCVFFFPHPHVTKLLIWSLVMFPLFLSVMR